jgi:hypothetical protein
MQIQILSIQLQPSPNTFNDNSTGNDQITVTIQMGQAVEAFCLTARDTFIGAQPAHLIEGDEHFERTFAHLEGLRGRINSLVTEVFLGHSLRLPITLDDSTLPVQTFVSA